MPAKTKPPARPAGARRPLPQPAAQAPLPAADGRWQRSVRYNWDKGGSRGGRK